MDELKAEYQEKSEHHDRLARYLLLLKERGGEALRAQFLTEMFELELRMRNLKWAMTNPAV